MKIRFLVLPFLFLLILAPLVVTPATGVITFTNPTDFSSFGGPQPYTISGTITPIPPLPDNVFIQVRLQGSLYPVDAQTVSLTSDGTFSYSTYMGGNAAWTNGTYVITASDSSGATASIQFTYNSNSVTTTSTSTTSSSSSSASTSTTTTTTTVTVPTTTQTASTTSTASTTVTATSTTASTSTSTASSTSSSSVTATSTSTVLSG